MTLEEVQAHMLEKVTELQALLKAEHARNDELQTRAEETDKKHHEEFLARRAEDIERHKQHTRSQQRTGIAAEVLAAIVGGISHLPMSDATIATVNNAPHNAVRLADALLAELAKP